jgi:hypothetical protein
MGANSKDLRLKVLVATGRVTVHPDQAQVYRFRRLKGEVAADTSGHELVLTAVGSSTPPSCKVPR